MKTFRHRIVAHVSLPDTRLVFYLPQGADDMLEAGELARAGQMKRLIDNLSAVLLYFPIPHAER